MRPGWTYAGAIAACLVMALTASAGSEEGGTVPLTAADLDPAALAAARRYYAMPSMQALSIARHDPRAIARRIGKAMPEGYMTDAQREAFLALAIEEFSAMKAERDETAIRVLAHVYTAEELDALVAFERTEIGRRIGEKRPIYAILVKEATASLRREALRRVMERFTGTPMEQER